MRGVVALVVVGFAGDASADLGKREIRDAINAHLREVIACYERTPPPPDRPAAVTFTIAASGRVTKAVGSGNPAVHDCLANVIRSIRFPASSSSTEVRYPFNIVWSGN